MDQRLYSVRLENFNGPLDLLLQLIEKQRLDICDISLTKITQDYIESIQNITVDPYQANWFLDIATRLILHKSRALLPGEDTQELEPIEDITAQLQILSAIRKASQQFVLMSKTPMLASKGATKNNHQTTPTNLNLQSIVAAYPRAGQQKKLQDSNFKLKRQNPIHLRQKIKAKWTALQQLELSELNNYFDSQYETVVCFLLALELLKDNKATLKTDGNKILVELT